MKAPKIFRWMSPLLVAVVWIGCGGQPGATNSDRPAPEASAAPPSDEALTILAKADSFDGTEDKVVSQCLTCGLGMQGKAEFTSKFGDYELHLCSQHCKESFDAKPDESILTAKLPESSQ